jgi:hypothetical protein
VNCLSQWPRCPRRKSAAARLLGLWVRIPPEAWMFVFCECCVLSSRGLCDELITRPEESYRLWCVVVCDLETSWMRRPWPNGGCLAKNKQTDKWTRKCVEGKVPALICGVDLEYSWNDCTCRRPRKPSIVIVRRPSLCSNKTLTRINFILVLVTHVSASQNLYIVVTKMRPVTVCPMIFLAVEHCRLEHLMDETLTEIRVFRWFKTLWTL